MKGPVAMQQLQHLADAAASANKTRSALQPRNKEEEESSSNSNNNNNNNSTGNNKSLQKQQQAQAGSKKNHKNEGSINTTTSKHNIGDPWADEPTSNSSTNSTGGGGLQPDSSSSPSRLTGNSKTSHANNNNSNSNTNNNKEEPGVVVVTEQRKTPSSPRGGGGETTPALLVSQMTTASPAATTTTTTTNTAGNSHGVAAATTAAAVVSAKQSASSAAATMDNNRLPPSSPQQQQHSRSSSRNNSPNSRGIPRYQAMAAPETAITGTSATAGTTVPTVLKLTEQQQQRPKDSTTAFAAGLLPPSATAAHKHGVATAAAAAVAGGPIQQQRSRVRDSLEQEQALFEQRLCGDDTLGVAVRKINQNGKANLRYVKCVMLDESYHDGNTSNKSTTKSISSRSAGSWRRKSNTTTTTTTTSSAAAQQANNTNTDGVVSNSNSNHAAATVKVSGEAASTFEFNYNNNMNARRALVWGKKKDISITLNRFTVVRKGKTTDRARRNASPASHVLSILTNDPSHPSLDIEAPTRLDRDKFARAFAKFLHVPLEAEHDNSNSSDYSSGAVVAAAAANQQQHTTTTLKPTPTKPFTNQEVVGGDSKPEKETVEFNIIPTTNDGNPAGGFWQGAVAAATTGPRDQSNNSSLLTQPNPGESTTQNNNNNNNNNTNNGSSNNQSGAADAHEQSVVNVATAAQKEGEAGDNASELSSLTGHGYDQELVEELHHALNELRSELKESRAEAARAVKVAEQAIQSAEKSNSMEWQNTVTHKAAEAAAQAQKRSAEAMAKQRLAEERLEGERRTAAFWRKQAEVAEEEAGVLQTRAAAAEVQRAAFEEQLGSERRMAAGQLDGLKRRLGTLEMHQRDALEDALERNRVLEIELDSARRELSNKDQQDDVENIGGDSITRNGTTSMRKKLSLIGRKKKAGTADSADSKTLLAFNTLSSSEVLSNPNDAGMQPSQTNALLPDQLLKVQAETVVVRQQFELLRRATAAELQALPDLSKNWVEQVSDTLEASQSEVTRLRDHLAVESASRRKLLHEVQDLRGIVRVYCRPRPPLDGVGTLSVPSREAIVLRREHFNVLEDSSGPTSFEFDHVFDPSVPQRDVYAEMENVCLGVLDGYNICIMAYGQSGCGKTKTLLGDLMTARGQTSIENHGVHLQAMTQLFSIAEQRCERYKDTFTLTVVEVRNERISDLLAGTQAAETRGQVIVADASSTGRKKSQKTTDDDASSGRQARLEIRTDVHGDTIVQGVLSLEVENFEQVVEIWEECLANRRNRLAEQDVDIAQYEASCNVIATLKVTSANITTGHGSIGKLQFVDLAGADLVPRGSTDSAPDNLLTVGPNSETRFAHRSLETLNEVVTARAQYVRTVPYRNSTLTHLLRDSLEADTKVLLIACISSDVKDLQETAATLRFASKMRHVTIGKATKHSLSTP